MYKKRFLKIATALLIMLSVSGCGDSSNTNGTLTLVPSADNGTTDSAGNVIVSVAARITPATTNYQVNISAELYSNSGSVGTCSKVLSTNSTGTTQPLNCQLAQSTTEITTLRITATSDGLAATPIWKSGIPAYTP